MLFIKPLKVILLLLIFVSLQAYCKESSTDKNSETEKIASVGRLLLSGGRIYEGVIYDGKMHGIGVIKDKKGAALAGQFLNNEYHGRMRYTSTKGSRFYSYWDHGKQLGEMER